MKSIKSDFVRTRFGGTTRRSSSKSSRSSRLAYGAVTVLVTCGMLGYHALLPDMDASREFLTQNTRGLFSLAAGNEEGGGASSSFGSTMFGSNTEEVATSDADAATTVVDKSKYTPAMVEQYIYDHRIQLGYEPDNEEEASEGCRIWNDPQETPIYKELHQYRQEIVQYWDAVKEYSWIEDNKISDVRPYLEQGVCKHLEVDPKGRNLQDAFFSNSQQLSQTNSSGFVEPLLPPMRHPNFCHHKKGNILNIEYLVHDFAHMCRKLKPHSRIVLFDMGASPKFAGASNPMWKIMNLFGQFGFKFDHIYAYEIKHFDTETVYDLVPRHLQPAYHWINAGVSIEEGHPLNPFTMLLEEYNEDDLIIVKLDIDTPSLEVPLATQLLQTPELWNLVDQFYFEHHVKQEENNFWAKSWGGTIKDTLELFYGLRQRGVPAHFWV